MQFRAQEWMQGMLRRHGLEQPDGRPLYCYKLGRKDMDELEGLLLSLFAQPKCGNPYWFASATCGAFVLYCAMRFAYTYGGGKWHWRELLAPIIPNDDWFESAHRSEIVKRGAEYFVHRDRITREGLRFIGYVAAQAGTPLLALSNRECSLSRLVIEAMRLHRETGCSVERLTQYLLDKGVVPLSQDGPIVCRACAEAAEVLNRYVRGAFPEVGTPAFEAFVKVFPSFEISPDIYAGFLDAARREIAQKEASEDFRCRRLLKLDGEHAELATYVRARASQMAWPRAKLAAKLGVLDEELPSSGQAGLFIGRKLFANVRYDDAGGVLITVRGGLDVWFRGREALEAPGAFYQDRTSKRPFVQPLGRLENMDLAEPQLFRPSPDHDGQWIWCSSASATSSAVSGVLMVPAEAEVTASTPGGAKALNVFMFEGSVKLYEVSGELSVSMPEGERYFVRLNCAVESGFYSLIGRVWGMTKRGVPIYLGTPEVECFRADRVERGAQLRLRWTAGYRRPCCAPTGDAAVVRTLLALDASGAVEKSWRMVVLPPDASVVRRYQSRGPTHLTLQRWGLRGAYPSIPEAVAEVEGDDVDVICAPVNRHRYDEVRPLEIECVTTEGASFDLRFDYPSHSNAFMLEDRRLSEMETVSLAQLRDLRALVMRPAGESGTVMLRIRPEQAEDCQYSLSVEIPIDPSTGIGELHYDEFRESLFRVLRLAESSIILEIDRSSEARILVTAFATAIATDPESSMVFLSGIEKNQLRTVRLEPLFPTSDAPTLRQSATMTLMTDGMQSLPDFLAETHTPWLVYDPVDERCVLRPVTVFPGTPDREARTGMARFQVLEARELWANMPADAKTVKVLLEAVEELFRDDRQELWDILASWLLRFGPRVVSLLPFWEAFRHRVPLAFTLALALDLKMAAFPGYDRRSLVFELGRNRGWRWDLMPRSRLVVELRRLTGMVYGRPKTPIKLSRVLNHDVLCTSPVLRRKVISLLWQDNAFRDLSMDKLKELFADFSSTPYVYLMNGKVRAVELNRLVECLRPTAAAFLQRMPRFSTNEVEEERKSFLRAISQLAGSAHVERLVSFVYGVVSKIVPESRLAQHVLADPLLAALGWELSGAAVSENSAEQAIGLGRRFFFLTERTLGRDEAWGRLAQDLAVAMAEQPSLFTQSS